MGISEHCSRKGSKPEVVGGPLATTRRSWVRASSRLSLMKIQVGNRHIGYDAVPLVIGEMSGNHNGQLERALAIVDAIAASGAHALKIQTYTADTITIESDKPPFKVEDSHGLWGARSLHDLYTEAHTPWEWHEEIFARARAQGLLAFSTPFDSTSIQLLEDLKVPMYKTASAELVDLPLLREVARTGKPLLISTGMGTLAEIDQAVTAVTRAGCTDLVLLACTASYPAKPKDARLVNIETLRNAFGCQVGISDHTPGIGVSVAAAALGATVIEKHVTLDRAEGGVDAEFSLNPRELESLVSESAAAAAASRGLGGFGPRSDEGTMLKLRRSLYVVSNVVAGEPVTRQNVRSIRPAGGLASELFEEVQGRKFRASVERGTPLSWDLL